MAHCRRTFKCNQSCTYCHWSFCVFIRLSLPYVNCCIKFTLANLPFSCCASSCVSCCALSHRLCSGITRSFAVPNTLFYLHFLIYVVWCWHVINQNFVHLKMPAQFLGDFLCISSGVKNDQDLKGVIPNSFDHIFSHIARTENQQYLVRASYLEIYMVGIYIYIKLFINFSYLLCMVFKSRFKHGLGWTAMIKFWCFIKQWLARLVINRIHIQPVQQISTQVPEILVSRVTGWQWVCQPVMCGT